MNDELKSHAKDYLVDFSQNKCSWLKWLILEAINTNGQISKEKLEEIYSCLKDSKEAPLPCLRERQTSKTPNIVLKKFEHISGVNALASNQIIKFSKDVTVLYGLNGSGKSSYFKVLNEIGGGNEQKEIRCNIYKDQPESIQVKLTYNDGNDHDIWFDNSERGFEPLTGCKVFDSSYLNGLLSQRTQNETILEPFGLHLFKYIADKIDENKLRIYEDADKLQKTKPTISLVNFPDELKDDFIAHSLTEHSIKFLKDRFDFPDEKNTQLECKKNGLKGLEQANYADRIVVLKTENDELKKIISFLKIKEKLERKLEECNNLLEHKKKKEEENRKSLEKIAILKELPLSGTNEWKDFIAAGEKLKRHCQTDDKVCIYCNQPLNDGASEVIRAYSEYLSNKSESELQEAKDRINDLKDDISKTNVELDISTTFKEKHKDDLIGETETSINSALEKAQKSIERFKSYLALVIDSKDSKKPEIKINPNLVDWLRDKYKQNEMIINDLDDIEKNKNKKIICLEKEIEDLLENKAISDQRDKIEKWLKIDKEEKRLRDKETTINTNTITRLSNTAHDELLTSALNDAFRNELDLLGYKNLEVALVKGKGGKGTNSTKLSLKETDSICSILSEGEQKAVGLALFIAEVSIEKSQTPVILDDPVNSLDHKIAANFADRLLSLQNQIIIFNHNRLFQNALETNKNGHICKTIDSACSNNRGKHIIVYHVSSEGKSKKGILIFGRLNNVEGHLNKAKEALIKSPFCEHESVSSSMRKTIECLIDETVFKGVTPTKYSNKNNRIPWDKLKNIKCIPADIDTMHKIHDRVSGGCLHIGTESQNNPIEIDEYKEYLRDLESIWERSRNE